MNQKKKAFSLIEASLVLVVISIIFGAILASSAIIKIAKLNSARNLTNSSIVKDIDGLILWLDSISVDSFDNENPIDNGEIENWNDIKESYLANYVATQANISKQPIFKKSVINSLPAIQFNSDNGSSINIANFTANAYMTIFVVGKFNNSNFIIEHGSSVSSNDGFMFQGGANSMSPAIISRSSSSQATQPTPASWFGSESEVGVMRYDGSNISYKLNSNSFIDNSDSDADNNITNATLYIGSRSDSSLFSDGYIGEIIIYDRALNDNDVDNIVQYLQHKWSI